ncbi:fimbrial protein, partial [Providencia sp. Je.9.19]
LENCQFGTPAAKNKVTVTFTGAASDVNADLLGITGSAQGAGVGMTAQGGSELIVLGTPTAPQTLADGNQTLNFAAFMQGEAAGTPVVEGAFQAVTDFTL